MSINYNKIKDLVDLLNNDAFTKDDMTQYLVDYTSKYKIPPIISRIISVISQ